MDIKKSGIIFPYFPSEQTSKSMKINRIWPFLAFIGLAAITGCASGSFGRKVKEPFQGSAYESTNRFWRGTGKGQSSQDNIARSKADLSAKSELAGQVNTTMKQVADQYLGQTQNEKAADVADKFQSLTREVVDTNISDLQKIGEKKFYDEKAHQYTIFIAYEIKKSAMLKFMKKQAQVDQSITESQRGMINDIIDQELAKAEKEDN